MEGALTAVASWLDSIGYSDWARFSSVAYPAANVVHLLGLVMLVGGIGAVDLRVAGLWRSIPRADLSRALIPVAIAGFVILVASGSVLFAADGQALASSATFHLKLLLILGALTNVVLFHIARRRGTRRGMHEALPLERAMALASLSLWLCVAAAGRMIAYS